MVKPKLTPLPRPRFLEVPTRMTSGGPVVLDTSARRTPHDLFPPESVKG